MFWINQITFSPEALLLGDGCKVSMMQVFWKLVKGELRQQLMSYTAARQFNVDLMHQGDQKLEQWSNANRVAWAIPPLPVHLPNPVPPCLGASKLDLKVPERRQCTASWPFIYNLTFGLTWRERSRCEWGSVLIMVLYRWNMWGYRNAVRRPDRRYVRPDKVLTSHDACWS